MAGVKGLLARVRKLEPKAGHVARRLGSVEAFESECMLGVKEGRYCPEDVPWLARMVRGWVEQGL